MKIRILFVILVILFIDCRSYAYSKVSKDIITIKVKYYGFDSRDHIGQLMVNKKIAKEVEVIFKELYDSRFPIERVELIDIYNNDDELSMENNNTYSYCDRKITGSNKKSMHSYGLAIDINPTQNPYIKNNDILPALSIDYKNRNTVKKGMIIKNDVCYKAFKNRGWTWGGEWKSLKDYQHFEKILK